MAFSLTPSWQSGAGRCWPGSTAAWVCGRALGQPRHLPMGDAERSCRHLSSRL